MSGKELARSAWRMVADADAGELAKPSVIKKGNENIPKCMVFVTK